MPSPHRWGSASPEEGVAGARQSRYGDLDGVEPELERACCALVDGRRYSEAMSRSITWNPSSCVSFLWQRMGNRCPKCVTLRGQACSPCGKLGLRLQFAEEHGEP